MKATVSDTARFSSADHRSSHVHKFLAKLSSVVTVVVLLKMTLGVAYFGWMARTNPRGGSSSH
jgi:hypothetical protein